MSLHMVRKCDECRAPKGAVNHWWAVVGTAKRPQFLTAKAADAKTKPRSFRLDFCSHKCVTSAFNRWLDSGSMIRPKMVHLKVEALGVWDPATSTTKLFDVLEEDEEYAKLVP